ncbi:hypothetical protein VPH35_078158 [Triticum aestivum]
MPPHLCHRRSPLCSRSLVHAMARGPNPLCYRILGSPLDPSPSASPTFSGYLDRIALAIERDQCLYFVHDQATVLIFSSASTSCIIVAVQERMQASTRCLKNATFPISSPSEHEAAAARQCLVNDRPNNSSLSTTRSSSPHARAVHLSPPVQALHHLTQCPFDRVCPFEEAENGV